jgi:DNA-binding transcriptional regulator YdaS (Cro superfamily)
MSTTALERAVEIAGGQKPLADLIGTTQSQVWYWLTRAKKGVPGEYVIPIEQATQSQVTRYDLRPDLYPRPASVPAAPTVAA